MNREELICSPEYLLERIQIEMFYAVRTYLEHSDLNNEDELQKYLKLTDKQMEDMMDGNSDLKLNKLVEVFSELRHDNIVLFWDNYYEQIDIIETFSRLQYCIVRDSFISKEINVLSAVLQADNAACNNT